MLVVSVRGPAGVGRRRDSATCNSAAVTGWHGCEHPGKGSGLPDHAVVEDDHLIGDDRGSGQVVRAEHDGQVELVPEDEVEHAGRGRSVEGR
jgi:hypothetical protein